MKTTSEIIQNKHNNNLKIKKGMLLQFVDNIENYIVMVDKDEDDIKSNYQYFSGIVIFTNCVAVVDLGYYSNKFISDKFIRLGSVDLNWEEKNIEEAILDQINKYHIVGIKLHPNIQDFFATAPCLNTCGGIPAAC